jgi:penicillin-binding protein 1A
MGIESLECARQPVNYVLENEYFGRNCYGIKAAAKNYCGKTLDTLTNQEALLLMALPKAPTRYDPVLYPKDALERSNLITERLAKNWPDKYGSLKKIKKIPATLVKDVRRCMPDKPID